MSGTAHSHFGLWGTWRRGPDLVEHVADLVAEHTQCPARMSLLYRDDCEVTESGEAFAAEVTGQGLSGFRAILIEGEGQGIQVRVAFVRRPTEILIGLADPRRARVRSGVVLEVFSDEPSCGEEVAAAKNALAVALERGRPRWVTRAARHGRAARVSEHYPDGEPGSASGLLERNILGWPKRSAFAVIFVVLALVAYAGAIVLMAHEPIPALYSTQTLAWKKTSVKWVVGIVALGVVVAASVAQSRLFPAVEVAKLTNARRGAKALASWATLSVVASALLQIPGFDSLFDPEK